MTDSSALESVEPRVEKDPEPQDLAVSMAVEEPDREEREPSVTLKNSADSKSMKMTNAI